MIPEKTDNSSTIPSLTTSNNSAMESTNKNSRAVMRLLADTKKLLGVAYSDEEFKQTFTIIKSAKSRGFLGSNKSSDCCLAEEVNIANDILRSKKFEEQNQSQLPSKLKALYVYVALVAIGLIPA